MFIRHSIDIFNNRYISGWIYSRLFPTQAVSLRFSCGGCEIGKVTADNYRKDLQIKGVNATGKCGFNFDFPVNTDFSQAPTLDIFINNRKKPFLRLSTEDFPPMTDHGLPKIMFMHIPKTAGTSFNSFMRLFVGHEKIRIHLESIDSGEYSRLAKDCMYLAGHLTLGKLQSFFDLSTFTCFTLIREPHAHLHSHLNWLMGIGRYEKSDFFNQHNKTIQALAKKVALLDFQDNGAVEHFVATLKNYELDFFDNCQTRYFLDYRPEKITTDHFEEVKKNLSVFKSIGITEQYDSFLEEFSSLFNLDTVERPTSFNKAIEPALYDISDDTMQHLFAPLLEADVLLYNQIKDRQRQNCSTSRSEVL